MIQLRKAGLVADREDVERLRCEFEENHFVMLRDLLDPQLLSLVLSHFERGQWRDSVESGFYSECVLENCAAPALLQFVSNTPKFLETISEITGCDALTWFVGRVYRMRPNIDHTDKWHDDDADGRLIGMSVNLSPRGFEGGLFQMREAKSRRMLVEIANTGLGDAIFFRLSHDFQHRVTEVPGGEPKTAFAGWFTSTNQSMRERLDRQELAGRVR